VRHRGYYSQGTSQTLVKLFLEHMEQNEHIKNDDDVMIMKITKRIMKSTDS